MYALSVAKKGMTIMRRPLWPYSPRFDDSTNVNQGDDDNDRLRDQGLVQIGAEPGGFNFQVRRAT